VLAKDFHSSKRVQIRPAIYPASTTMDGEAVYCGQRGWGVALLTEIFSPPICACLGRLRDDLTKY